MLDEAQTHEQKPLVGNERATLDKKGRLLLSTTKRERLGPDFVLSLGARRCLLAYPEQVFDNICKKIAAFDPLNEARDDYARLITTEVEVKMNCDTENRFVVPAELRQRARMRDQVIILGLVDHLEIWAAEEYERFNEDRINYEGGRRKEISEAYASMTGRPA